MKLQWLEPQSDRETITTDDLTAVGVLTERLELAPDAFQPALDALKEARGYVEQDIVELEPGTPNLDALCDKFIGEHLHTDDEVRYVLEGEELTFYKRKLEKKKKA